MSVSRATISGNANVMLSDTELRTLRNLLAMALEQSEVLGIAIEHRATIACIRDKVSQGIGLLDMPRTR